jgi:hypothetical protein
VNLVDTFPYALRQPIAGARLTLEESKRPSRQGIGLIAWNADGSLVALKNGSLLSNLLFFSYLSLDDERPNI